MADAGWLERRFKKVNDDLKTWPEWLLKAYGLNDNQISTIRDFGKDGRIEEPQHAFPRYAEAVSE